MAIKSKERRERIAKHLRVRRAEADLDLKDIAQVAGIDPSTAARHERGETCMDLETAWDLADLYGVSLDELSGREWPPPAGDAA